MDSLPSGFSFDVAIFDEAHKTAGRSGAKFSTGLSDNNIPIDKRVFFTATPRHYDVSNRDKHGDAKKVFSMDDTDTYGPIVHKLSFSKAVSMDPPVITGYKVAISVVTQDDVDREILRQGIVMVDGDSVRAKQVAHQLALKAAVDKYGVRKIFSFHSTVKSADVFTGNGNKSIATHLPEFRCMHINGKMRTAQRSRLLIDFAEADKAILSNARCLTEGVDVPAVDMVAFLSPKKSVVDIVQATGRAMRKSEGKEIGYVLIPVFLERAKGETFEQSVQNSDFQNVWNVLNQLQEHDDLLEHTIRMLKRDEGETGHFDPSSLKEKIEVLANEIDLDSLQKAITAECVRTVGESWFKRYGQLIAYKKEHGNCNVPARYDKVSGFSTWVVYQRVYRNKGTLEAEKIRLLDEIGFNWDPRGEKWNERYSELVDYKARFGNCRVSQTWKENPQLAKWVGGQRKDRRNASMPQDRIDLLENIGFEWTIPTGTWENRFAELVAYKERFGDTRVPAKWEENQFLGQWVARQRYHKRKGILSQEKTDALEQIGLEWDLRNTASEEANELHLKKLTDFHKENGHLRLENNKENSATLAWLRSQRQKNRDGSIDFAVQSTLDNFGFEWDSRNNRIDAGWEDRYLEILDLLTNPDEVGKLTQAQKDWLRRQREKIRENSISENRKQQILELEEIRKASKPKNRTTGKTPAEILGSWDDCYSKLNSAHRERGNYLYSFIDYKDEVLESWVSNVRKAQRGRRLNYDHRSMLDAIGFHWDTNEALWQIQFLKFKDNSVDPNEFNLWIRYQRKQFRENKLPSHRQTLLENAGIEWDPYDAQWNEMYKELLSYTTPEGSLPSITKIEDEKIRNWATTQRRLKKRGKLQSSRERKLNDIGFQWENETPQIDHAWLTMLSKLSDYFDENQHFEVSQGTDRQLSSWISYQRKKHSEGTLTEDKIALLEEIDFPWSNDQSIAKEIEWNAMFIELLNWNTAHGSCSFAELNNAGKGALVRWLKYQLKKKSERELTEQQGSLLGSLSTIQKDAYSDKWDEMYSKLQDYKEEFENCVVPANWERDPELARWVRTQRQSARNGSLKDERRARLDNINFEWQVLPSNEPPPSWNERYEELRIFYQANGHTSVPRTTAKGKSLAMWLSSQRVERKNGRLSKAQEDLMNELQVDWDPVGNKWLQYFDEMKEFIQKNGHSRVPQKSELGRWAHSQRQYRKKAMPVMENRIPLLDEIGFEWEIKPPTRSWDEMFEALRAFKEERGHCNVPQNWKEDKQLGKWVNHRRGDYKLGKLTEDMIQKLESLGFVWNTRPNYKRGVSAK
ncbi:Helicase associated domain protein [Verrucomicrobiia bacterium DG1235]|nr:Helicase associated domain protein [Verrucomicrobiae bacterium DG1235]